MNLNPDATALVVIDMQNDFAHPDGALAAPASQALVPTIRELIETSRAAGLDIVYTRDVHTPDQYEDAYYYDEFEQWGEHVVEGTWGAEIVDELTPEPDDKVVRKSTYDAFHGTDLNTYLTTNGITDLVIVGTLANVCVLHTASSAGLRDYRPLLVEDAIGYIEEEHREYALEHADWLFGEVITLGELELD